MRSLVEFKYDVFLSHNRKDKPRVRRLAQRLSSLGVRVWFDEWVIQPGDDIYLRIEAGLEASRVLILCLSPAALGSDWVSLERSTVLFRDPSNRHRRFIPLLLADVDLPDTLRRYKYVDYRQTTKAAFEELLTACRVSPDTTSTTGDIEKIAIAPMTRLVEPVRRVRRSMGGDGETGTMESVATRDCVLVGHESYIHEVAFSPDRTWLASCSTDKSVKVWDLATGKCRRSIAFPVRVLALAITLDGRNILCAPDDGAVHVIDAASGSQRGVWRGHNDQIRGIVPMSNGASIVTCSDDRTVRVWDIETGNCIGIIEGGEQLLCVAVTPDGKGVVTGTGSGMLRYWDIATRTLLHTFDGHTEAVYAVVVTPDGRHAISASKDSTIKVWSLTDLRYVGTLEGHEREVEAIALSPDGALLISVSANDHSTRIWDLRQASLLQQIIHEDPISVAFASNGQKFAVGTAGNSSIYLYGVASAVAAPREPSRRYVNAKVVLVGESGVGKSALAHRLIEDRFVETHSTHGMQVWRLDLPKDVTGGDDGYFEREALLWDLAGQEDYRLIHQLFLDETALALILINPQKPDPFAEAAEWIRILQAVVGKSKNGGQPVSLLIAARADVGDMKISQNKIKRFMKEYGLVGYLKTSANTGENCSDALAGGTPSALRQMIADRIPWDMLPWTSTPRLLAEIKNAVIEMRDKRQVRLLRFAEVFQRLEHALRDESFTEADVRTALTLLANHGLVTVLTFGDLVLMRPELLNGYSSAVVRAARSHVDEIGSVREADVYETKFDFTGVDRLDRADEELLLRAMVQMLLDKSLCIAEDTPDGRQLVFPSQYRRDRPIPTFPEIFISYTFVGEWQMIYTTLVVRLWYSREFEQKELWRNAAEFTTSRGQTVGLLMERSVEGGGTISVFFESGVADELKWALIKYVQDHLAKYARDVRRDRRYVCSNCGKAVTDLQTVQDRLQARKDFITCQKCDERVPLIDFVEQRLTSDPVAQRVLSMERKASDGLDAQALQQILVGHMMAVCGEANQIFRPVSTTHRGINGEVEFKDKDGAASGWKVYVHLKTDKSFSSARPEFDEEDLPHLVEWTEQPFDVYLVLRNIDESGEEAVRWMNVSAFLKSKTNRSLRHVMFDGEKLDAGAVWRVRDGVLRRSSQIH